MACSRGKASPNANVQRRLFAASGGYCQNPGCNAILFIATDAEHVSIAEMAHIFAAQDDGPRANNALTAEERGAFENLILLCANCHTLVDKAPDTFTDQSIQNWKRTHEDRIAAVFGAVSYPTRRLAFDALRPLLGRTNSIFQRIGPNNEYRTNPESDEAVEWRHQIRATIIPTNRSILALMDRNYGLLTAEEAQAVELLRQHIEGMERRHIFNDPLTSAPRYPEGIDAVFST